MEGLSFGKSNSAQKMGPSDLSKKPRHQLVSGRRKRGEDTLNRVKDYLRWLLRVNLQTIAKQLQPEARAACELRHPPASEASPRRCDAK
jgi:hypothetical protein